MFLNWYIYSANERMSAAGDRYQRVHVLLQNEDTVVEVVEGPLFQTQRLSPQPASPVPPILLPLSGVSPSDLWPVSAPLPPKLLPPQVLPRSKVLRCSKASCGTSSYITHFVAMFVPSSSASRIISLSCCLFNCDCFDAWASFYISSSSKLNSDLIILIIQQYYNKDVHTLYFYLWSLCYRHTRPSHCIVKCCESKLFFYTTRNSRDLCTATPRFKTKN